MFVKRRPSTVGAKMNQNVRLMKELLSVVLPVTNPDIPFIYPEVLPRNYKRQLKPLVKGTVWEDLGTLLRAMFRLRLIAVSTQSPDLFAHPDNKHGTVHGVIVPDVSLMQIIIRTAMQEMFIADDMVEKMAPLIDRRRTG